MTYFDFFNFAPEVKGPALVTMSQNDDVATPEQVLSIYNHLRCSKRLAVYEYENHLTDADREEFYYETYLWLQGIGYVQGVEKKRRGDKVMRLLQR